MKHFVFLFVALFSASFLFSQEVFKLGTVKGKHVTYEVKEQNSFPWGRIVKNTRKSDTAKVEVMDVFNLVAQTWDIEMQIAKIIHDRLLPGELRKLSKIAISWYRWSGSCFTACIGTGYGNVPVKFRIQRDVQ